MARWVGARAR